MLVLPDHYACIAAPGQVVDVTLTELPYTWTLNVVSRNIVRQNSSFFTIFAAAAAAAGAHGGNGGTAATGAPAAAAAAAKIEKKGRWREKKLDRREVA